MAWQRLASMVPIFVVWSASTGYSCGLPVRATLALVSTCIAEVQASEPRFLVGPEVALETVAMKRKISVHDLACGMWVCELDRPWRGAPFLFQGFEIRWQEEIDALRKLCEYVYIDTELGAQERRHDFAAPGANNAAAERVNGTAEADLYQTSLGEELQVAKEIHASGTELLAEIMENAEFQKKINSRQIKQIVADVASSVIRNPNAFALLTGLKSKDTYTYAHSLDVCVLALVFGRYLGFSKEELEMLGTGTLLFDIGKTKIPKELLEKPGRLTAAEFEVVKRHVGHSVAIMSATRGILADSIEIAHTHHEHVNGHGYPRGLAGKEIPIFGKIAAIVDCYDAMTSDRPYARARSPHRALRKLYEQREQKFQDVLIEQFIQCLGVYPVGSVVELSTGEVGVVLAQNRVRRLRPKVMLVLDKHKKPLENAPAIDLMTRTTDSAGKPLEIVDVLEPGAYNIDARKLYL